MRKGAALFLLLLPGVLWAAKDIPFAPRSYVLNEDVISAEAEARLSRTLSDFEQSAGHQFVVALFQSLDGESLEDYSNRVFRAWKIGDAKTNDGLLFCLFKRDRKWRVEVGYGLEGVVTDLRAGEIARDYGVPHFKTGDFDGGVQAVVEALAAKLQGKEVPVRRRSGRAVGMFLTILFIFIPYLIFRLFLARIFSPYRMSSRGWSSDGSWGSGGGGSWGGGGFSGGGGSSGGGGASGGW